MKRIGVLTSGGDAAGMNACIRAIVRTGLARGLEVYGIQRGYTGMIGGDMQPLDRRAVANIIQTGGTVLGTSRSEEFKTKEGRAKAVRQLEEGGIEGLVLIGGDGTFRGGTLLQEECGIPVVGIPGTIDNDVYGTDYTIGFDTAVATALDAIDKIRDTAQSQERLFFVEVMGRHTGFITLAVAIAGGAEEMIIPEDPETLDDICHRLEESFKWGKRSAIVVVCEAGQPGRTVGIAEDVSKRLNTPARAVVLGHIQRGGMPTSRDRILASRLGVGAVDALLDGERGVMVGEVDRRVVLTPMAETWSKKKDLDDVGLVKLFRLLSA
jgi:6-phosphofructokinase 1